jgi:hypothetical protein
MGAGWRVGGCCWAMVVVSVRFAQGCGCVGEGVAWALASTALMPSLLPHHCCMCLSAGDCGGGRLLEPCRPKCEPEPPALRGCVRLTPTPLRLLMYALRRPSPNSPCPKEVDAAANLCVWLSLLCCAVPCCAVLCYTVPAGWAASTGQDFTANHAIKTIDYGGFHIWPGEAGGPSGAAAFCWQPTEQSMQLPGVHLPVPACQTTRRAAFYTVIFLPL